MIEDKTLSNYKRRLKEYADSPYYPSVTHFLNTCMKLHIPVILLLEDATNAEIESAASLITRTDQFDTIIKKLISESSRVCDMRKNKNIKTGNFTFYFRDEVLKEMNFFTVKYIENAFLVRGRKFKI